jgi:hypothetical protein
MVMRIDPLLKGVIVVALLSLVALLVPLSASIAQTSPPYYINREYRFAVIFPGEPMARDVAYVTSSGTSVPARQFYIERAGEQFTVTVVVSSAGPPADNAIADHAAAQLRQKGQVRFEFAEEYEASALTT